MLRELEILKGPRNQCFEFCMDDFHNMHHNLKKLLSISVHIYPSYNFLPTLDTIPNTAPAFAVTTLNINWDQHSNIMDPGRKLWNPLWLYYFGYKYPNLRSLRLNTRISQTNTLITDKRGPKISLFQSNPNAFKHLETFDLTTDRYFTIFKFPLLRLFRELRFPLRHLILHSTQLSDINASCSIDVNEILESFSETLQSFSVKSFKYIPADQDPTFRLSAYYPVLTNLFINTVKARYSDMDGGQKFYHYHYIERVFFLLRALFSDISNAAQARTQIFQKIITISSFGCSIDLVLALDNLLNRCAALKELDFCGKELLITPSTTAKNSKQQQHGLQILTLRGSVASEVFNYLSLRCRGLKHIALDTLHIKGSICEKTECLLLDMPHTFLKTLNISHLRYDPSYKETNVYYYSFLTLLSQLNDVSLTDEKTKRERNEIDPEHPILTSYHLYDGEVKYMEREYELHNGYGQFRFGKVESVHVIEPSGGDVVGKIWFDPSSF
ncbi:hypothetical protein PHYBLDRAFT_139065 [Phycomyces blakesleeanus NRRL 1555(-)]|uniref:F-box domain-containing protein n=1 Tax=Phycomyces blakesleeanus (strain ATCC 8743b / DSM 1359 / FGSC 10004 / NBRC 33097 / NRRL 1555) TaxID=763407 RepID=A0A162VBP7_PHYB8|nr:hypothetical protein PHYBLDRAFT_139065 [Phycomyces blakesleeanus NRRL 1555(-)]OAD81523.1 hypothetical protein PHYBLDRAFT_139065 [Phycomyces blakesleeanus NRRL 1555(-)]|eukprot:XP_018299563.1 hypothetical protein PHYBLDRAFT_139065 [Phycomyces blakesleeanus NRRL 1555(-)]